MKSKTKEIYIVTRRLKEEQGRYGLDEFISATPVLSLAMEEVDYMNSHHEEYPDQCWDYHRVPYTVLVDEKTGLEDTSYTNLTKQELLDAEERENSSLS